MSDNELGDEGIKVLARLLASNIFPPLRYIDIDSNEMGESGLAAIVRILPQMAETQLAKERNPDTPFRLMLSACRNRLLESRRQTNDPIGETKRSSFFS